MFDFSFAELVVIMLVALIVIGPERLPKVARTGGQLWGRLQRYVLGIRNDINNELALEEAQRLGKSIDNEIAAIGQFVQDAKLTPQQKILQARHGKPAEESGESRPSVVSSPATPDQPT